MDSGDKNSIGLDSMRGWAVPSIANNSGWVSGGRSVDINDDVIGYGITEISENVTIPATDSPYLTTTENPAYENRWLYHTASSSASISLPPLRRNIQSDGLKTTKELTEDMLEYEQKYGTRSSLLFRQYGKGMVPTTPDFSRWARIYKILFVGNGDQRRAEDRVSS